MCAAGISEAARKRTAEIVSALGATDSLVTSSRLPGWTRLTLACHLRYGALASLTMTNDALSGAETSFYPGGRSEERPSTLEPRRGEGPDQVVASLGEESTRLHDRWAQLSEREWQTAVREPQDNSDLGETTVAAIAVMRLTEVEVHGSDLDIGLDDWSEVFVTNALPFRIGRLAVRRSNHRVVDSSIQGSWKLVATDGPSWKICVHRDEVTSDLVDPDARADAVIEATSRDLLAILLGRPVVSELVTYGDTDLAGSFARAFPGP